jgi:pSer/pThr/pTyr-binding forkhead associated (FHA) protein
VSFKLNVMIMSGFEDGHMLEFQKPDLDAWILTIGRENSNDIFLEHDTFISRHHARLIWDDGRWILEDLLSTNGTFIENADDFLKDRQITQKVDLQDGQLFRIGRTWLMLETVKWSDD